MPALPKRHRRERAKARSGLVGEHTVCPGHRERDPPARDRTGAHPAMPGVPDRHRAPASRRPDLRRRLQKRALAAYAQPAPPPGTLTRGTLDGPIRCAQTRFDPPSHLPGRARRPRAPGRRGHQRNPLHPPRVRRRHMRVRAQCSVEKSGVPSTTTPSDRAAGGSSTSPSCTSTKTSWSPTSRDGAASACRSFRTPPTSPSRPAGCARCSRRRRAGSTCSRSARPTPAKASATCGSSTRRTAPSKRSSSTTGSGCSLLARRTTTR